MKLWAVFTLILLVVVVASRVGEIKHDNEAGACALETGSGEPGETSSAYSIVWFEEIFDRLDHEIRDGKGYKDCLNTDGFPTGSVLAWSESYLMQAYAKMFCATGDEKYLNKLYEHIESVLSNRDDYRGQPDYKGDLVPAWGTDRYAKGGEWKHFIANTAMITFPMLQFVLLIREHDLSRLARQAEGVLSRVEESIKYHDDQWRPQEAGYGLYVYRADFYRRLNYVCPLSQQAAMGRSLLLLWQLTHNNEYLSKATDLATAIKSAVRDNGNGGYVWGLFIDPASAGTRIADISHSTITIHFAVLAHKAGLVFNQADMVKLTTTVKSLWRDGRVPRYIDGSGDYAYELAAGQYAFLGQFDPEIWDLCHDLLFKSYKVHIVGRYLQEDWWGTVMLGIARLARFVSAGYSSRDFSAKLREYVNENQ